MDEEPDYQVARGTEKHPQRLHGAAVDAAVRYVAMLLAQHASQKELHAILAAPLDDFSLKASAALDSSMNTDDGEQLLNDALSLQGAMPELGLTNPRVVTQVKAAIRDIINIREHVTEHGRTAAATEPRPWTNKTHRGTDGRAIP